MESSRKTTLILRVASIFALGAILVPLLASAAAADSTILQGPPLSGSTTVTASSGFTDQLTTTGGDGGTITFATTSPSSPAGLAVNSSGFITTSGTLAANTYSVSGTDSDGDPSDDGIWSYSLTVSSTPITQTVPLSGSTTPGESATFTDQLATSGGVTGSVVFLTTVSSSPPGLVVSPTGAVSTSGALGANTYTISGTDSDGYGDTGSWGYSLTVNAAAITQSSPLSGSTTPGASSTFSDLLTTSGGVTGSVVFLTTVSSSPPGLVVSPTGAVSTSGTLAANTYTISGTDSDGYGDTGSWGYSLTVNAAAITQSSPLSGSTTPGESATFTDQLATSGGVTGSVVFLTTVSSSPPGLVVSPTGAVSTSGTLAANTYTISGTDSDGYGDTGSWSYSLVVNAATISQGSPTSNEIAVTPASSSGFTDQLDTSGNTGNVSYTTTSSHPAGIVVSSTGAVSLSRPLAVGTYTAVGTDADPYGDAGTWSYTLTITASRIDQSAPTENSVTPSASANFTEHLATSGNTGTVSFTTTSSSPGIKVSSAGVVSTTGLLAVGSHTVSGTDADAYGDSGVWSFTLKVTKTAITQAVPFSNAGSLTPATSATFTEQLKTNSSEKVDFVTTSSNPSGLLVSSSGRVSTKGALAAGTYTVAGTDSDGLGDSGTWGFSLTVTPTRIAQSSPNTASTTTGKAVTAQLKSSGTYGTVSYTQSTGRPSLTVSSSGVVTSSANLAAGTYKATGTVSDNYKDTRPIGPSPS